MADLNALIAQGTQFQAPVNPFVQYAQMQQLQQGEQANQLNQMKMQEYQRGMEETNAMRRLDPNSPSYLADITRINPEKGFAMGKMRQESKTAGTEGQIKDTKLIADKLALLPDAYRMADTPEAYLALHKSIHADPVLGPYLKSVGATPEKGMATLQNAVQTGKFNELRMGSMQSVAQILESMKPMSVTAGSSVYNPQTGTFTQAPATAVKNIGNVNPGDFTPASMQKFNASGNYADLIPKPTRVAGDGTGVAKAPAGYRVTANGNLEAIPGGPAASKPMTDLQIYKLRTDVAKDYKVATDTLSKMDDLLESIDKVKTAPGLAGATGYLGKLPSFPEGASAQAESRLANLRGKVTALGKATAAMSGSIGSIANQEWKILADQVAVLDEVKGVGPLLDQIGLVESQAKGAIDRIRDGYEKTRSEDFERFPQFRDLPASKKLGGTPAAPTGTSGFKYLGKEGQ
jgi:hypothetical protein